MESKPRQTDEMGGLYILAAGLFEIGWWASRCVALPIFACVGMNWLDDFLRSPIGIKGDPPPHGAIVEIAKIAFWPVVIMLAATAILEPILNDWQAKKKRKQTVIR